MVEKTSVSPDSKRPTQSTRTRSLERLEDLVVASVYEREIAASLERVWENVYDWEHLPWLHSEAFSSIEKLDSGSWGWHARIGVGSDSSSEIELELVTDKPGLRYVSRTLEGAGAPSEIWTGLDPVAADRTAIRVEFCVRPAADEDALRRLGEGYVSLYTLLWDQDESMMQIREAALADDRRARAGTMTPERVSLGNVKALRAKLPLVTRFAGEPFRVVELDGELVAHGLRCPHLRGPLENAEVIDGQIECPWHGYRFDVESGRSCDGRGLRLARAPLVLIDPDTGEVELGIATPSA